MIMLNKNGEPMSMHIGLGWATMRDEAEEEETNYQSHSTPLPKILKIFNNFFLGVITEEDYNFDIPCSSQQSSRLAPKIPDLFFEVAKPLQMTTNRGLVCGSVKNVKHFQEAMKIHPEIKT